MIKKIVKKIRKFFKTIPFKGEKGAVVTLIMAAVVILSTLVAGGVVGGLMGIKGLDKMANSVLSGIMTVFNLILGAFFTFAVSFFQTTVYGDVSKVVNNIPQPLTYKPFLNLDTLRRNSNFISCWKIVRDFANMLIALGFVICGIGTALRIQEYEAKKTLVPLILVALLVNFTYSLWFDIFEVSNSITESFLRKAPLTVVPFTSSLKIWSGWTKETTPEHLVKGAVILFMNSLWALTYFTYGLFFVIRWAVIPILVIFSPLALVCLVFKFSEDVWWKWFKQFIGWCLFGIIGAISIYVANIMLADPTISLGQAIAVKTGYPSFEYLLPLGALVFGLFLAGAGSLVMANTIMSGTMAGASAVAGMAAGGMASISGALGKEVKAPAGAGAGGGAPGAGAGAGAGGAAAAGGGFPGTEAMTGRAAMGLAGKAGEAFKRVGKVGRPAIGPGVPTGVRAKAAGRATMAVGKGLGLGAAAIATKSLPAAPGIAADVVKSVGGQLKGVTGEVSGIGK